MSPAKRSKKAPVKMAAAEAVVGGGRGAVNLLPGADRKAALGAKHVCFTCEAKFYDLNKPEPVCPRCGTDQRKRPRTAAARRPAPTPAPTPARRAPPEPALGDDDADDDGDSGDDEFIDDDMEIDLEGIGGDDDDDLSEFPRSSSAMDDDDRDG